jgi:hypothetical protein
MISRLAIVPMVNKQLGLDEEAYREPCWAMRFLPFVEKRTGTPKRDQHGSR